MEEEDLEEQEEVMFLDQIQSIVVHLKLHYPVLVWDEQFQKLERLVKKDSSPRSDRP